MSPLRKLTTAGLGLALVLMTAGGALPAEISVLGSCVGRVGAKGLLAGWASKKGSTYRSARDEVLITICNTAGSESLWRVDIRRSDLEWPKGVKLRIRRTGDGMGGGMLTGGRTFQQVKLGCTTLCTGTGDRTSIPLQFELTGVSLDVPVGTHATSIIYTVVEIGG